MRRADRLFQIVQILRRHRRAVTAEALAEELEISKRSVYRDIAALMGQRVPIRGEAGVGYVLDDGFDLPPLMLTGDEAEAAALGAQWVVANADPDLARAAQDLIAKITAVAPPELKRLLTDPATRASPARGARPVVVDAGALRRAIRTGRKAVLTYRDEQGRESLRTVWPILIGYVDAVRILAAWCELRTDFRSFRLDRIVEAEILAEAYPARGAVLRAEWRKRQHAPASAAADQARSA
jgi:predicted DNA-binding transcriptional regulator YafY